MGLVRVGIAVFLTALALAPAAQAAQRYAAPAGSGAECTQTKPCSLNEALAKAKANDEVIVTGGSYTLSAFAALPFGATGAYVHGDFSGPRPTISGSVAGPIIAIVPPKSRVSYLDISNSSVGSSALYCGNEVVAERLRLAAKALAGVGLQMSGSCTATDSVVRADGEMSIGVLASGESPAFPGSVRNLTAIATGPKSTGLRVTNSGFGIGVSYTLKIRNSIVSGDEYDLRTFYGLSGPGNIDVAYSNFDAAKPEPSTTIAQGPGNQTTAPLFVNAGAGDYREAAGSPTIDAGTAEGISTIDFDGNPRALGAAPDIGAYEVVPPPVLAAAPGQIQSLAIAPKAFKPVNAGGAVLSAKKKKAPVSTTVTYSLSAASTVAFSVERKLAGRRVGKRCVKKTKSNAGKKKCPRYRKLKGGFSHTGVAGQNRFKFSGRVGSKALKRGSYRLTGKTSASTRTANFRIVK
jgi:hypothetical protein